MIDTLRACVLGRSGAAAAAATALLLLALTSGCGDTSAGSSQGPASHHSMQPGGSASPATRGDSAASKVANADPPGPAAAPGPSRAISFDNIKFVMDKQARFKRTMLTPQIEALNGKAIRIRGFILPSFKQHGLTQFVLVRDNMQCCFGPTAALYDCIMVEMDEGSVTDFSLWPVEVEGVFEIREFIGPNDKCLAIYHIQCSAVRGS